MRTDHGGGGCVDAVSRRRCYRDVLPLQECYDIIARGRGQDFDPDIVDTFMMDTDKVEAIYARMMDSGAAEAFIP